MFKKLLIYFIPVMVLVLSVPSSAAEFQIIGFDSISMGGAGTALSRGSFASYYNPALLAEHKNGLEMSLSAGVGLREVSLGSESGSPRMLREFNKRFGPGDVHDIAGQFGEYGIHRVGFLMLGGPGETRKTVEESLAFMDSLNLETVKITLGVRIYPHTALAERAVLEGRIASQDDLLFPQFYMVEDLKDWLSETVQAWLNERPNWFL